MALPVEVEARIKFHDFKGRETQNAIGVANADVLALIERAYNDTSAYGAAVRAYFADSTEPLVIQ
jgi:hypothetical protein